MFICKETYYQDENGQAVTEGGGDVLFISGAVISDEEAVKRGLKEPTGNETFEGAPQPRPYRNVREARHAIHGARPTAPSAIPAKPAKPDVPQMNAPVKKSELNTEQE